MMAGSNILYKGYVYKLNSILEALLLNLSNNMVRNIFIINTMLKMITLVNKIFDSIAGAKGLL